MHAYNESRSAMKSEMFADGQKSAILIASADLQHVYSSSTKLNSIVKGPFCIFRHQFMWEREN